MTCGLAIGLGWVSALRLRVCWAGFDCIVFSDFGFVDGFCMLCFACRFWCVLVLSCCGRLVLRRGLRGVVSWVFVVVVVVWVWA